MMHEELVKDHPELVLPTIYGFGNPNTNTLTLMIKEFEDGAPLP